MEKKPSCFVAVGPHGCDVAEEEEEEEKNFLQHQCRTLPPAGCTKELPSL